MPNESTDRVCAVCQLGRSDHTAADWSEHYATLEVPRTFHLPDRCRTDRDDALLGYDDAERVLLAHLGVEVLDTLRRGVGHGCTPMDHLAESAAELGLHP
jgi:hypothetical protein